jgi:hypothetical protein
MARRTISTFVGFALLGAFLGAVLLNTYRQATMIEQVRYVK